MSIFWTLHLSEPAHNPCIYEIQSFIHLHSTSSLFFFFLSLLTYRLHTLLSLIHAFICPQSLNPLLRSPLACRDKLYDVDRQRSFYGAQLAISPSCLPALW